MGFLILKVDDVEQTPMTLNTLCLSCYLRWFQIHIFLSHSQKPPAALFPVRRLRAEGRLRAEDSKGENMCMGVMSLDIITVPKST